MDAMNTIKVTVEPTKTDSVIKPETTVNTSDSANSVEELENKKSFSDALKGEMENKSDSQNNENAENGNNLPNDSNQPFAKLDPLAEIFPLENEASDLSNILPDGLVHAMDKKLISETVENSIDSSDHNNRSTNAIQGIFQQISSAQNQLEIVNVKADSGIVASEIIKTIVGKSQNTISKFGMTNDSSIFQGSLSQLGSENLISGNIMPGFDFSANSQQQNNLNQQFTELQMRLLNQDKLANDNTFDITKLTQTVVDTPKSSSINDLNPLNQTRSPVSELMIKTPIMDKQWNTEFNNHIAFVSKSGGGNAIIKLNPAHLGPIEASIRVVNEVATIQIAASHITTRDAMDAAIPRLKEMLEEQGFSKVNVDISEKGFSHNSSQESRKTKDGTSSANDELVDEEEGDFSNNESMTVLGKSVSNGVVDYFA
jgi:flagellar hook-length control protein FliK